MKENKNNCKKATKLYKGASWRLLQKEHDFCRLLQDHGLSFLGYHNFEIFTQGTSKMAIKNPKYLETNIQQLTNHSTFSEKKISVFIAVTHRAYQGKLSTPRLQWQGSMFAK